jgi:hypothetical protein
MLDGPAKKTITLFTPVSLHFATASLAAAKLLASEKELKEKG